MEKQASFKTNKIWLFSKQIDLALLLIPVWCCWLVCFAMPDQLLQKELPLWFWAIFILGIDVSHVWSTIFRTYLDREEFTQHKTLLTYAPLIGFISFFALASISQLWFWRVLAYMALYHFVKQQYGFLALYYLKSGKILHKKILKDRWIIYFGMLYPVAYWHLSGNRAFNWFVQNDFIDFGGSVGKGLGGNLSVYTQEVSYFVEQFLVISNYLYWVVLLLWLVEEWYLSRNNGSFQTGKVLWVLTTAVNWYLGIVYFNSDIAFSLTNVVAHGIPYMVLVFFYVEKKKQLKNSNQSVSFNLAKRSWSILLMFVLILVLAFGEEYLWDMLLYREKQPLFEAMFSYPFEAAKSPFLQAIVLALLSIPQVSHYIIDGYIWKGKKNPFVKRVFTE